MTRRQLSTERMCRGAVRARTVLTPIPARSVATLMPIVTLMSVAMLMMLGAAPSPAMAVERVAANAVSEPSDAARTAERELMEADRAFDRAAAERGIDGWVSYFTPDAARVVTKGPIVRGHEAIRKLDGPTFSDPKRMLTWEPIDAGLFDTGDHGFTRGRYRVMRVEDGKKEEISAGWYLSIWRREAEGWKVILDTGGPDEKPGG